MSFKLYSNQPITAKRCFFYYLWVFIASEQIFHKPTMFFGACVNNHTISIGMPLLSETNANIGANLLKDGTTKYLQAKPQNTLRTSGAIGFDLRCVMRKSIVFLCQNRSSLCFASRFLWVYAIGKGCVWCNRQFDHARHKFKQRVETASFCPNVRIENI